MLPTSARTSVLTASRRGPMAERADASAQFLSEDIWATGSAETAEGGHMWSMEVYKGVGGQNNGAYDHVHLACAK